MRQGIGVRSVLLVGVIGPLVLATAAMGQTGRTRGGDSKVSGAAVLRPDEYRHYVEMFRAQEKAATGKEGEDSWGWMEKEIPWFEASDKSFEEMYYFRWYAWQKHLVETKRGYVITEWLPKPEAKDGFFGALPDAAPFHIGEARWLREKKIAEDDARFWMSPDADARKYSFWVASTVLGLTKANGDDALGTSLLPALKANYAAWEASNQDTNGLFWQIDTRDAMEKSISGDGYRPTLNSYMFGDARAIAEMAGTAGDGVAQAEFNRKADALHGLIETNCGIRRASFMR
jgi:hypothetical protein